MKPLNPNAYHHTVNDDPRNDIQIIIGDDKHTPFEPQTKMTRFGNEANLSMRLQGLPHDNRTLIKQKGDTIEYGDEKKKMRSYPKTDNDWEFDWIFFDRPEKDFEVLTLQIKNLEFYKQLPLNEEITPAEGETVTATHHYDAQGNVLAHRPEEIVNSYAVYLSRGKSWNRQSPNMAMMYKLQDEYKSRDQGNQPAPAFAHLDTVSKLTREMSKYEALSAPELSYNKTYMTGKFSHIYRPKLIDANGNESWADIDIDREKAEMTITYNKEFLDTAAYPVVVDPTFGYTSAGASEDSYGSDNRIKTHNYTIPEDGTITKLTVRNRGFNGSNLTTDAALYNSGATTLLDESTSSVEVTTSMAWTDYTLSGYVATGSTEYEFADWHVDVTYTAYDTESGFNPRGENSATYPTWPTTWGVSSTTRRYSIYATYTASGGSSFTSRNNTVV